MWELRLKEIRNVSKVKRLVSAEAEVWAMQVTSAGPQAGLEVASWLGQTTTLPPPPVYETASCSLRERAVLLCPCLFHFFTEHSYWSWVSHSTEAGLIWLVKIGDIQSKSSQSEILSLGFLALEPETKPNPHWYMAAADAGLRHESQEQWADIHWGKWRQEGNWVMAEPLM